MKTIVIISSALSLLLLFGGCESSSDTTTSDSTPENTEISTESDAIEAAQAINLMLYAKELMQDAYDNNITIESPTEQSAPKRATLSSETLACNVSGSITVSVDVTPSTSSYNASFDSCIQYDATLNGAFVATLENGSEGSEVVFNNFIVDSSIATLTANFTSKQSSTFTTSNTLDATLNGKLSYVNKSITSSGYIDYDSFKTFVEVDDTGSKSEYNGDITLEDTLLPCISGKYSIKTLTPIVTTTGNSTLIDSGAIEINDALFTFNAGSITVSTNDGQEYTIAQDEQVSCNE